MIERLAAHFSRYSLANLAVTVASIVSFPILTRVFSVAEYGLMSLIGVLITVAVAFGKLGIQHAAMRFYSEVRAGQSPFTMAQYEATVVFGLIGTGAVAGLLWLVIGEAWVATHAEDAGLKVVVIFTAGLVFGQAVNSAFVNQLRARELSGPLSIYTAARRYVELALILVTLFWISRSLSGFYGALLSAELISTLALAAWFLRRHPIHLANIAPAMLLPMMAFGLPLIVTELSSVMLSLSDRFVIQALLGAEAVGVYAAPYNLCEYISSILVVAFTGAVHPMVLRLWADKGRADTETFLRDVLHLYLMFSLPMAAGTAAVGEPMIAVFASAKFLPGAEVIPWVIGGLVLQGLFPVAAAGLYIRKQSGRILAAILTAAVANLVLNFALIPRFGIVGAGVATAASYGLMLVVAWLAGSGTVRITIDWARIARFAFAALVMATAILQIHWPSEAMTLAVRVVAGGLIYPLVLLAIDPPSRRMLGGLATRAGLAGGGAR